MGYIYLFFAMFICVGIPVGLTLWNIFRLVTGKINLDVRDEITGASRPTASSVCTVILGVVFTLTFFFLTNLPEWDVALYIDALGEVLNYHTPISGEHSLSVIFILISSAAAFLYLRFKKSDAPPLALVISMSFIYIGITFSGIMIYQISEHLVSDPFWLMFYILYPINYIILGTSLLYSVIKNAGSSKPPRGKINLLLYKFTSKSLALPIFAAIMLIPTTAVCVGVFTLFGQEPASAIKAFTETADWALSAKTPPPSVYYDGHYLCTVGARGHKKLVKPIRYGVRHGHTVVCNRQLLVANAFEELISEKLPRTHKIIRKIYDTYGYPIAKHIKSPFSADVIYILMLPLHFFFTVTLYLFDKCPEDRIAAQYTGRIYAKNGK